MPPDIERHSLVDIALVEFMIILKDINFDDMLNNPEHFRSTVNAGCPKLKKVTPLTGNI